MASSSRTDAEAIAASLANPRAFEAIFDRHFSAISRYLRRRLNREIADELAAEVFTTAFAKRRSYDLRRSDALPWLYGIAVNLVRRHSRDEQQELRAHARAYRDADWTARGPLDELLDGAVEPEIAAALLRLDHRQREVLLLFAWANLDYDEIATALELPLGTVKSRLNRARGALRASLCGSATSSEEAVNG
jgi:RNA polymerase sigma-70 factor (ECF subfamily)